jgi:TDG/mug DNA glycosylase family protein
MPVSARCLLAPCAVVLLKPLPIGIGKACHQPMRRRSDRARAAYPLGVPLCDRIKPGVRVLFVGINPGIRSAQTGHHFAGYSNRFWKLLSESRLVPQPIDWRSDRRLPEWGFGITNLVARETPGIDTLRLEECLAGIAVLRRKVRRFKPRIVAFVGVSVYRWVFPTRHPVRLGAQQERFEDAEVFVLPNPSGRNANFSYAEMLSAFRSLRRRLDRRERN